MDELKEAIDKSQALEPFKDQLLLDITPEGLRIQIVDAQNRPMFDLGSRTLKDYTAQILKEVALPEHGAQPHQPHRPHRHNAVWPSERATPTGSSRPIAPTPRARALEPAAWSRRRSRAWSGCPRRCCSTRQNPATRSTAASASS
jgi:hypothetical protein